MSAAVNRYQPLPALTADEYADLRADIAERGVMIPVEYDDAGEILDGHHRVAICRELNISEWPRVVRRGLSEADKLLHARKLNLARRHLNQEQRRALIASQLRETPQVSDRQIADGLGTDHKVVGVVRHELEGIGAIPQCSRQTSDGRVYPGERSTPHLARGTGDCEWYTPPQYLDAAREVMGSIDLDPASTAQANVTVRATRFYAASDDGLAHPWHGNVWLNPPYSQPLIGQFIEKLIAEHAAGGVSQAVLLTNNSSDTAWFHCAMTAAALLCFPRGRINFVSPDGAMSGPLQGQTFFYFGARTAEFHKVFQAFGAILRTVDAAA